MSGLRVNQEVYNALWQNRVYVYELADYLGIHENTLLRRLRKELPQEEKEYYISLILKNSKKE